MSLTAGKRLVDDLAICWGTEPKNYTGAASSTDIFSFKSYGHYTVIIKTGAWAGGTAAVTLRQSKDVSATAETGLNFDTMFTNKAAVTSSVLVETAVASNTFNLDTANAIYVIEVDADNLDVNNEFDCFSVDIATPGANNDFYDVTVIGSKAANGGGVNRMPNALID